MTSSYWFQGQPGGGGDPGDPIGQSLRFRAQSSSSGSYLHRTGWADSGNVWTFSCWVKGWFPWSYTTAQQSAPIFSWHTNAGNQTVDQLQIFGNYPANGRNEIQHYMDGGPGGGEVSNQEFNDPAAWYHIVWQSSSVADVDVYVNGVQVTDWRTSTAFTSQNFINKNSTCSIGARAPGNTSPQNLQYNSQGYMADVYFIDNQALEPTAFGRYNTAGVWVPAETNFAIGQSKYSDFLTCSGSGFATASPATNAFDGLTTTLAEGQDANSVITWTPPNGVAYTSSVKVWSQRADNTASINGGTAVALNENAITEIATGAGTINTLTITGTNNRQASLGIIEIDSDPVLNPYLYSPDLYSAPVNGETYGALTRDFKPTNPATQAFDGITGTSRPNNAAEVTPDGNWCVYQPANPITVRTSLRVYTRNFNGNATFSINQADQVSMPAIGGGGSSTYGWADLSFTGELTSFGIWDGGSATMLFAIEVDGQILIDGVNNSYGANGFHLDFADPNDLGADRSGNGNDFTATGFGTNPPNNDLLDNFSPTASLPPFNEGQNAMEEPFLFPAMFNGLATVGGGVMVGSEPAMAMSQGGGVTATWNGNLSRPIGTTFSILIYREGAANDVTVTGSNGNTVVYTAPSAASTFGIHDLTTQLDSQSIDEITSISWTRNGAPANNGFGIGGIEIDGRRVTVDGSGVDYDLMQDSPTQNFATLNPLYTNGDTGPGTLSDGNLGYTAYTAPGYKVCPGTQSLKGGAYYWEYTAGNVNNSYPGQVGILRGTNPALTTRIGWDTNNNVFGFSLQYNGQVTGDAFGEGSSTEEVLTNLPTGYVQGDVIGMHCDIPNNYLAWYKNGVLFYEITNVNSEYDWMPALNQFYNFAFNSINFGQQPFRYPLPAGYQALQTQNLPAAPIANGREHFEAITWAGNDVDDRVITTTEGFAPGLVWIKCRNSVINHVIYDTVRGAPNRLLPNLTNAEDAAAAHLKSFTSNGFTLGTSGNVNGIGNDYVAWCWKAGEAAVANNDGSIESQVSSNTDAGFSIVTYTGNVTSGNTGTFGHGLNEAPEFVITKCRSRARAWECYHVGTGNTRALFLNESSTGGTSGEYWRSTDPNNQVVTVGGNPGENGSTFVAYCWHSVPGFSYIGSYTGNNNVDGVFLQLGFRPAYFMVKNADDTSNWIIYDNARDTVNVVANNVAANLDTDEDRDESWGVDFLSNGIKLRTFHPYFNADGVNYVYLAFAENPINISNAR